MNLYRKKIAPLFILCILLAACAAPAAQPAEPTAPPTPSALSFTDGLGRQVTLAARPERIVSMAPSNTELLYAVGAGSQVVGRDEFSDYPAEAKALPSVGGSMGKYNFETIASLKPDLVLAAEINTPEQVQSLEALDVTVYYLSNPTTLEGLYTNLETVGALSGHSPEAASLVAGLKERIAAVDSRLQGVTTRPLVYYELDATDPGKPYTLGPGTFIDQLIQRAGGTNIGASLTSAYGQLSLEEILAANPEVILLGDAAYGVTPEQVAARPGWSEIQAVKNGRVEAFDDNLVSRPTPRLVDGLETLAKLIHPEAFQ